MSVPRTDLVGQRFGRLVVAEFAYTKNRNSYWKCVCDCGNTVVVRSNNLKNGQTKSCGCYHRDRVSQTARRHGESGSPLHNVWNAMKQRCDNPKCKVYKYYGGRGITYCDEWSEYVSFRDWAVNNGYEQELTLDRIDVNGNYTPDNCRWVTMSVQNSNKRPYEKPKLFKHVICTDVSGITTEFKSIKSAAEHIGGNVNANRTRIHKALRGEIEFAFGCRWRYA